MFGSDIAKVVAPTSVATNTIVASRRCPRKIHSAREIVKQLCAGSNIVVPSFCRSRSGHDHRVTGMEEKALRVAVGGDDLVVVAWDALEGRAIHAEDDHLRLRGEGVEASGERAGLEHRRAALEVVAAWLVHLADHRDPEAAHLADDDRHLG